MGSIKTRMNEFSILQELALFSQPPAAWNQKSFEPFLVAPDPSNPADSESTNSGIFCSEGLSSNSSNLGHVDPE